MERVILTTGGTGGHIFPALAVAETIGQRFPGCRILFVGGTHGPEARLADEAGLEFRSLPSQGLLGKGIKSIPGLVRMARGVCKGLVLARSFRPDVIVGFGGYAGFPMAMAGTLLRVPTAIHEQNSVPGMSNRVLAKRVERIFLSFADSAGLFPRNGSVVTGNPVRQEIVRLGRSVSSTGAGRGKNLLILGGSQGATAINEAVMEVLPVLCAEHVNIWHQTGERDSKRVREHYKKLCPQARVEPFIRDMAAAYNFADLVVCRAGATTLAELTIAGKAAVLIPFPYAVHDHQTKNAKHLEAQGAALVIAQGYLGDVNLGRTVTDLLDMPEKLRSMCQEARNLGRPKAADDIVTGLEALVRGRTVGPQKAQKGRVR
ncbi:undecaprenyldiphospho-muramoylpentapeptide beta-N-acetylglucosaminyltransferase [Desulfoplanes sp.]